MDRTELKRTVKFVLFSISAGVIEIGVFTLLDSVTGWSYWAWESEAVFCRCPPG